MTVTMTVTALVVELLSPLVRLVNEDSNLAEFKHHERGGSGTRVLKRGLSSFLRKSNA